MIAHRPGDKSADMMSTYALGQLQIRRSGYGAMQLAGQFAFGTPPDRASAIGVLQAAVAAGVDHIDTAQYYGPGVVNDLIRDALHPYPDGLAIVSKVAVRRDDSGAVLPVDDPDQRCLGMSAVGGIPFVYGFLYEFSSPPRGSRYEPARCPPVGDSHPAGRHGAVARAV